MIDLRSDTVTKPTAEMRAVMASAEVGDDVLGDDPTVQALEARTAEVLGKEAALFMPSGTMSNQVAVRCHTQPGDEIYLDANAHIFFYECGAPAALSGVTCGLIPAPRGIFGAAELHAAIRPSNIHFPRPALVCIENTHNRGGGSVWLIEQIAEVADEARRHGLSLHLDGARLWNASVATGVAEAQYAQHFDSVSVCFSKGLGAPMGSALAGSAEFIRRARRIRKMLGGGMRQVGIVASGALYALEHHRERLAEDHVNARRLAEGVAAVPGLEVNLAEVQTNIVMIRTPRMPAEQFAERLKGKGVLALAVGSDCIRAVTSLMVSREQIDQAVAAFASAACV